MLSYYDHVGEHVNFILQIPNQRIYLLPKFKAHGLDSLGCHYCLTVIYCYQYSGLLWLGLHINHYRGRMNSVSEKRFDGSNEYEILHECLGK